MYQTTQGKAGNVILLYKIIMFDMSLFIPALKKAIYLRDEMIFLWILIELFNYICRWKTASVCGLTNFTTS